MTEPLLSPPGTSDPTAPTSPRPPLSRSPSSFGGVFNKSYERYERWAGDDWAGAMTLFDVVETYFDSRIDLLERRLKAQSARIKNKAAELIPKGLRTPRGGGTSILYIDEDDDEHASTAEGRDKKKYRLEVEREVERIRLKLAAKVTHLSTSWQSAQIVRTRDKVSFLFGVMSLTFTCLLFGMAPEWLPFAYTVQSAFYLPTRIWTYKRKAYHYFLFGSLCYFVNILDLIWLWVFPSSTVFYICCYLLTLGPIASAIITWRNSLVFHSLDKVTSLFIHMYPPLVLTVVKHFYKGGEERYPALKNVGDYKWWQMILISAVPYIIWQVAYWKFILVDRKVKVESGERQTSFNYMLNDKRGTIGKLLQGIPPQYREISFIAGQLVYSVVYMIPPACLFIHSPRWSGAFLIAIFAVSAWNGASFYVEVFGRKFERELEKLRKEMEAVSSSSASTISSAPSRAGSVPATPEVASSSPVDYKTPAAGLNASPLVLGEAGGDVPELTLPEAKKNQ